MREETYYRWRIQHFGKWSVTRFDATEEHIRKEHPEAIRLDHTKVVRMVPETEAEYQEIARVNSTSGWLKK